MKWRTPAVVAALAVLALLAPDIALRCGGLPAEAMELLAVEQDLRP